MQVISKSILEEQLKPGVIDGSGGGEAGAGMKRTWSRTGLGGGDEEDVAACDGDGTSTGSGALVPG